MVKQVSARASLVLAIVSLLVTPVLLWVQTIALLFADLVTYEPSNPLWVKVLVVVVVIALGVCALLLPLFAFLSNARVASRVIAGIALGVWGLAQVFFILGLIELAT